MASSQYLATAILTWIKGTAMPAAPTQLYLSLHDGNPGVLGANNNVQSTVTGSANRTPIIQADLGAVVAIPGGGFERLNTTAIIVTNSAVNASSVFVSHGALWDAISGGNCLQFDALAVTTEVRLNDLVKFDPASFSVSCL
jgi:hypothetical protein